MKIKTVGQKIHNYGTRLGHKLYGGIKSLGHKVYDSRYKLLAGTGAAIGAGLLGALGVGAQAIAQAPAAMNAVKSKFPKMSKPQFPYDKIDKTGYGIMPPKNMKSDFSYEHPEHRGYANRYYD